MLGGHRIRILSILVVLLAVASVPPAHADGTFLGRGTIVVNDLQSPVTNAGVDGVDGFSIDVSALHLARGTVIHSHTTATAGAPFDIDFRFYAADGTHLEPPKVNGADPCETLAVGEQSCGMPLNVASIRVVGHAGVALDVSVFMDAPST